jgi:hypothetical protein
VIGKARGRLAAEWLVRHPHETLQRAADLYGLRKQSVTYWARKLGIDADARRLARRDVVQVAIPFDFTITRRSTHLVIIFRDGVPEIYPFRDVVEAAEYADRAGAQWSETYVTEILKGPLV